MTKTTEREKWEDRIEEVLRNKVLDITDEYKGRKFEKGVQVYLDYPKILVGELNEVIRSLLSSRTAEIRERIEEMVKNYQKHSTRDCEDFKGCENCNRSIALQDVLKVLEEESKVVLTDERR